MHRTARLALLIVLSVSLILLAPTAGSSAGVRVADEETSGEPSPTPEPSGSPEAEYSESPDGEQSQTEGQSPAEESSSPSASSDPVEASDGSGRATPRRWAPPDGVVLSDPNNNRRAVVRRILSAVRATNKGHFIRIATYNFKDWAAFKALKRAKKRGVRVQVIADHNHAGNAQLRRLKRFLNRNRTDKNWVKVCHRACRSRGPAMHMKFALFSKVNWKKHVSMVTSANITTLAGRRQWNDLVTQSGYGLWKALRTTFAQMRRDRNYPPHPTNRYRGRHHLQLWPAFNRNPIANHLKKVDCWHNGRRTVIRIAIASWFGDFGEQVARMVRRKWVQGCDVRALVTLTGGGVRSILRNTRRGPVPTRPLTGAYQNGVPSKYLHIKAVAIRGKYGRDGRAKVLLSGSPNWTGPAQKTDENVLRVRNAGRMVNKYIRRINGWFNSRSSSRSTADGRALDERVLQRDDLPDWFELD